MFASITLEKIKTGPSDYKYTYKHDCTWKSTWVFEDENTQ